MPDPKKNTSYTFYISLIDSANRPKFIVAPNIEAGDFMVSTDGSAFTNLATLPTVDPTGSRGVKIQMSAGEMNGDRIMVQCIDTAGAEWDDVMVYIDLTIKTVDEVATQASVDTIDDFIDTEIATIISTVNTIAVDVAGLDGAVMRGTDGAALASVCTETRLSELDAANLPTTTDAILVDTGTTLDAALAVIDANVDAILVDTGTTLDAALAVVDANVDAILVDTGTTLDTALAVVDANVDAILVDTTEIGTAGAGLTTLGDTRLSNLDAAVTTRATPAQILTTVLTESYAADGSAPTLAQALFMLLSEVGEFAISGTTITCKKLDGSTTAMTFTLDDGTNPTSRTRAT